MAIDNNAAFIWSDHKEFDGINSLEQLKHLIGAESIEGQYVGAVSGNTNGLYIVGAASNWSITITFSFKSKFKYTLDGTTTIQNLSTTHTINAPAQNALLTELNVGILPQELYRINQSPQFFYAEVSTNNVSTGKINKSSIPVAGPTGSILDWVQVNNYGIATKSFQGPVTQNLGPTGPYTFNNPTGVGLKPANFGLNEADYRVLAADWNEGSCTQARIENGHLIYTVNGQETSIEVTPEVAENYTGLYVFNKISNVEGQTLGNYTSGIHTAISALILYLNPNITFVINEDLQPLSGYILADQVKEVLKNKYFTDKTFSLTTSEEWQRSVTISTIVSPSAETVNHLFMYRVNPGTINIKYTGYKNVIPQFSINSTSHSINGFDEPGLSNAEGGVGNSVYSLKTNLTWLNQKMYSVFANTSVTYTQQLNDPGQTFFTYWNFFKHDNGRYEYWLGNCWLYFCNNDVGFSFPYTNNIATATLTTNPGFLSNFHADSHSDNKIFMPGNSNLAPTYITSNVNQLKRNYTIDTGPFNTGYVIVAMLKQPS